MTFQILIALIAFTIVASGTPGPNNLMLMASGANYGMRRTVPHMMGIVIGFGAMVFIVGVGLAGVFQAEPRIVTALQIASVVYMLYLAWKIANSSAPKATEGGRPFTFLQAAAFQWVNPKAWAGALTAVTVYAADRAIPTVAIVALVSCIVSVPSVLLWSWMGTELRRWLSSPARLRAFNWTMAALLVASLWPVLAL